MLLEIDEDTFTICKIVIRSLKIDWLIPIDYVYKAYTMLNKLCNVQSIPVNCLTAALINVFSLTYSRCLCLERVCAFHFYAITDNPLSCHACALYWHTT